MTRRKGRKKGAFELAIVLISRFWSKVSMPHKGNSPFSTLPELRNFRQYAQMYYRSCLILQQPYNKLNWMEKTIKYSSLGTESTRNTVVIFVQDSRRRRTDHINKGILLE